MEKERIDVTKARDIVREQQFNLRKAIPQGYLFTFVYGLAWMIGYGALALTKLSKLGYIIFGVSLAIAMLISMVYIFRTLKGVKTAASKYMAWWGISWWIGFLIHIAIVRSVGNALQNVNQEIVKQISWSVGNSIPLLIVSLCFFGGAALFRTKEMGILGIIISVLTIVSANLTPIYGALLCAVTGLVMLLFAVLDFYKFRKAE